jgi:hypothetical protein
MKINEVEINDINVTPFKLKSELQPDLFKNGDILDSQIRMKLLDIADDFIKSLEVKWIKPLDIILTGSIVNYNWTKFSDIDVHIIYDFKKIYNKTDFVQDYFMTKRTEWNNSHDKLTIKGFPVELSVEDVNTPLQSSGIYSLEKNKWIKEPEEIKEGKINFQEIKKICAKEMTQIDDLFNKIDNEKDKKKLELLGKDLEDIIERLHDERKKGLKTKEKELSTGNIIWKIIKHMGYVDKIHDYINNIYDKCNTIKENKVIIINENQYNKLKNLYLTEAALSIDDVNLNESLIVNSLQVSDIVNHLNKFYQPFIDYAGDIGGDGLPCPTLSIGYVVNNQLLQKLKRKELLDIINDKFRHFIKDDASRLAYYNQIIEDWLNKKVKLTGQLSVNVIDDDNINKFKKYKPNKKNNK